MLASLAKEENGFHFLGKTRKMKPLSSFFASEASVVSNNLNSNLKFKPIQKVNIR
ncbi:MAG: hypothetical protein U5L45_21170 [Saprospiraceae bacterium]|nr:hypothetical protein [Saprospiraceae bacterium]